MTRSVADRLQDILNAIDRARFADAQLQIAASHSDAAAEQMAFDSILHNLFVIGEAVKALPIEVLEREPDMPWNEIAAMRDVIGHHYHRVVPEIIHGTATKDLGPLEVVIIKLLDTQ